MPSLFAVVLISAALTGQIEPKSPPVPAAAPPTIAPQPPAPPAPPNPPQPLSEPAVKDDLRLLAYQLEAFLVEDRIVGNEEIQVKVADKSSITIEGTVSSDGVRDRISRLVTSAAGPAAAQVANNVRVRQGHVPKVIAPENAQVTALDDKQVQKLRDLIREKMPEATKRITLSFHVQPLPTIVLEGVIYSYDDKLALDRLIRENYKGLTILNNIRTLVKPEVAVAPAPQPTPLPIPQPAPVVDDPSAIKVDLDTATVDRPLADEIVAALRSQTILKDAAIVVQVEGDVVWLRGSLQSPQERVLALNKVYGRKGVGYVIDDLTVNARPGEASSLGSLSTNDAVTYVRSYVQRRVSRAGAFDVVVVDNRIEVELKNSFLDDDERLAVVKAIEQLSKELKKEIVVKVGKN